MNSRTALRAYDGTRCLVTGHTGFKGSWLCLWLRALGAQTTGYALNPPTTPSLFEEARVAEAVADCRGNVLDADELARIIRRAEPQVVFHLAAQPLVRSSYDQAKETFDVNVGGTVNLLEVLRSCRSVRAIVVVTSDKCYENHGTPHACRESDALGGADPYSASKAAAEIVASSYARSFFGPSGVGLATARAGNVIGGGDWAVDRIIPDAVKAIGAGKPLLARNPDSVRPWQHVLDPLFGYLCLGARLLEESTSGSIRSACAWNFGPYADSCRPVRELAESFIAAYGEGSWEAAPDGRDASRPEAGFLSLDWDKASQQLAWRPLWRFQEAVRRASEWYRRHARGADGRDLCLEEIGAYMERVGGQ